MSPVPGWEGFRCEADDDCRGGTRCLSGRCSAAPAPEPEPTDPVCPSGVCPPGDPDPPRACTRYVSPGGSDSAAGALDTPWRTLGNALSRLVPGDVLCARGGTYYESATLAVSGSAAAPITFQAFPGERVVVDSGSPRFRTPGNDDWELVDAALGEYRSKEPAGSGTVWGYVSVPAYRRERVALVPYTSAAAFRASSDAYVDATTPFYVGPGTYRDSDGRIHIRLAKTAELRAVEAREGMIFPDERPDPRAWSIVLSQAEQTLRVDGSDVSIRDLEIGPATASLRLGDGVHDVQLSGLEVWAGYYALSAPGPGVHHVSVRESRIYGDDPPWIFWTDRHTAPLPAELLANSLVFLGAETHHWEIAWSHLRGAGNHLLRTKTQASHLSIHHNRFEDCSGEALYLGGSVSLGRVEVFENWIGNCLAALAPGTGVPQFTGPLYFYRNVVALLKDPPVNRSPGLEPWNGGGRTGHEYLFASSAPGCPAHYYHNTLLLLGSPAKGLNLVPASAQDVRIANNLLVVVNGTVNRDYPPAGAGVIDGNLYWKLNDQDGAHLLSSYGVVPDLAAATGYEQHGLGAVFRRGTDPLFVRALQIVDTSASRWLVAQGSATVGPADFLLQASSPARGAGIVIPPHPVYGALPDSRQARDIGALPFGTAATEFDRFPFVP